MFTYPIYKESTRGVVIKFTALVEGAVIATGDSSYTLNEFGSSWLEHTNPIWKDYKPKHTINLYL